MSRTSKSKAHKRKRKPTEKTFGGLKGAGWFKHNRSDVMDHIQARNPIAWCLLGQIAKRAWRGPGINQHGCRVGEAFIGDITNYNWTEMQYRVAKKVLLEFGQATFRTTNRGTIAKLISNEIYDINAEESVTDRSEQRASNDQTTSRQRASNDQTTSGQRPDNDQTTTNKNLRIEEDQKPRNQEKKTTNNTVAGAPGGGGILPPSEVSEGEEPESGTGTLEVEEILTPAQKALQLSKNLPKYIKLVARLNQLPVFTQHTMLETVEYFKRNDDYIWEDVMGFAALGMKLGRENPPPEEGPDPFFYSRRFAHKPNRYFDTNTEGDLFLACIQAEVEATWHALSATRDDWLTQLFQEEASQAANAQAPA